MVVGTRVHATSDLFGLSLDEVEGWIKECRTTGVQKP